MRKLYFSKEEVLVARRLRRYKASYDRNVLKENFIERIPFSGCWIWTGCSWNGGYGYLRVGRKHVSAHRYFYELYKGPFDQNLNVCHTCDVRCCVNPDHLWLGTQSDNMYDMYKKNRKSNKGILNPNSKLSEEDLIWIHTNYSYGKSQEIADKFNVSRGHIYHIIEKGLK